MAVRCITATLPSSASSTCSITASRRCSSAPGPAGVRVRLLHHRFWLRLGPLTLREYERFLPGRPSMRRLVPVVRNYVGDELGWNVNLLLRHDEVPQTRLGQAGQLGWTSWI